MEGIPDILGQGKVVVELTPSLERFTDPESSDSNALKQYLLQLLNDLIADLRIPVEISLHVKLGDDKNRFGINSYQVSVNDSKCRLQLPTILGQDVQAKELAGSIVKVIHQNRDLFITIPLAEKIRKEWSSVSGETDLMVWPEKGFPEFLSELVRRGFRIDRGKAIVQKSKDTGQNIWSAEECFEEAVSGFDTTIKVFFNQEGAKIQSPADKNSLEEMFDLMQDGLFYELGIILPGVKIDTDESLDENEFRIQLNDLRSPPDQGPAQDEFLVNDTSDRLFLLNLTGKKAVNPANGTEGALVQDRNTALKICEKAGLTSWGPAGFVILALSSNVRRNAGNFLTTEILKFSLDRLNEAFPDLVDTTLKRFDEVILTRILRDLLDEELSIRDLRGILEALLEVSGSSIDDQSKNLVSSPHILSLLRKSLDRYISNKCKTRDNTLVVYLLDKLIEKRIMQERLLNDEERDRLIKAFFGEFGVLPVASQNPIILTTLGVRKKLKNLIEKEFPRIFVLCYQELGPDLNIQPIARITWDRRIGAM